MSPPTRGKARFLPVLKQVAEKIADLKSQIGTMAAANNLLDVYQTYYDMSTERIERETAQGTLF